MLGSLAAIAFILLAGASRPAEAQPAIGARAGLISAAEGEVFLEGKPVDTSRVPLPRVREEQTLRTGAGRAEVQLNPCAVVHVDENSAIRLTGERLTDTRVELITGSAIVRADMRMKDTRVTVLMSGATAGLERAGNFRFETAQPRVRVIEGTASLDWLGRRWKLASGREVTMGLGATPVKFDARAKDAFDRWSEWRVDALVEASGALHRAERKRSEEEAATRRLGSIESARRDPRSGSYDPNFPQRPNSLAGTAPTPSGVLRWCEASGR